ncbi:hypothetical protein HOG48_04345 [Candidatus Peregrinibacteria bacterium]|jgi:MinD-like ATPase involved in chromosome partitioning or flagellar assembly|nr:hypothetical protein [Candidatus Peregrinibacteria bacterium]
MNEPQTQTKQTLAFLSAKGGTGQTLIASNMAYLASKRNPTLFIQLTEYPDAHTFFNTNDEKHFAHIIDFLENKEDLIETFRTLTYKVDNLHIVLSPKNSSDLKNITDDHITNFLKAASMIFETIVIDIGIEFKNADPILKQSDKIIVISNLDPQSITRTNRLVENLEKDFPQTRKHLIINQTPLKVSKKEFQKYFKKEVSYVLPFDHESAWDNIAFSTPYTTKTSKLSKKTEEILDKILT